MKLFKAVIVDRVLILLPLKQKHPHSEEQNFCLWQTHVFPTQLLSGREGQYQTFPHLPSTIWHTRLHLLSNASFQDTITPFFGPLLLYIFF